MKNNTATDFEKNALSNYYAVISLKENEYVEYKFRKQKFLIELDNENVKSTCKEKALEKYDEVIVVLASAEASFTEDNPLTAAQRMEITNAVLWARHNGHFWIFPVAYNNYIAENMSELKLLCPDFNVVFSTNPVHAKMARLANIPSEMPKIKAKIFFINVLSSPLPKN